MSRPIVCTACGNEIPEHSTGCPEASGSYGGKGDPDEYPTHWVPWFS